jgi:DNA-binding transcriptional ArsR family regulator
MVNRDVIRVFVKHIDIMKMLSSGEMYVAEISRKSGLKYPTVYARLKKLKDAGLVTFARADGKKLVRVTENGKLLLEALEEVEKGKE